MIIPSDPSHNPSAAKQAHPSASTSTAAALSAITTTCRPNMSVRYTILCLLVFLLSMQQQIHRCQSAPVADSNSGDSNGGGGSDSNNHNNDGLDLMSILHHNEGQQQQQHQQTTSMLSRELLLRLSNNGTTGISLRDILNSSEDTSKGIYLGTRDEYLKRTANVTNK